MAETKSYEVQPQLAQLECLFNAPLVKDSQVNTFNDLLNLKAQFAYKHKIVWVIDEKCNYFLNDGDGTVATNWERIKARAVIGLYNPLQDYLISEAVYLSGKIYVARQTVPEQTSPLNEPDYWLCISGETITYRYIFQEVSSVIFYTEVRNPVIEVMLSDFEMDGDDVVINPVTGLANILNEEVVDVPITRRPDLTEEPGTAYEIIFYEDSVNEGVIKYSGCINIK